MRIEIIPCLQDNYSYLIIDESNNFACVVDPSESEPIINFLKNMKSNWTISIFHYRTHGADVGKIVIGVLIHSNEVKEWNKFVELLGYKYWDETKNQTYKLFLGATD